MQTVVLQLSFSELQKLTVSDKLKNFAKFFKALIKHYNMGRIKSTLEKRTSRKMLKEENSFTDKFEDNKKVLASSMPSKKVRNKIAGYITRLKRIQQSQEQELRKVIQ